MINFEQARKFCREDISLIENYEQAVNDETHVWHCHHKNGIAMQMTPEQLQEIDLYFNRPACELQFLTISEHLKLHNTGVPKSEETRRKMSESKKGHIVTEECRNKISNAIKGEKCTYSKHILQIDTKTGEVIKEWHSIKLASDYLCIQTSSISRCCSGQRKSAGGYIWKYADI